MIALRADRVLTGAPDAGPAWVTIDGPDIVSVGPETPRAARRHDLGDLQLWPGAVDLHADSLPRFASPRAGVRVPLEAALADFAFDAAAHGITRPQLCLSVGEGPDPTAHLRHTSAALRAVEELAGQTSVPLSVHLRVEVSDAGCVEDTRTLLDRFRGAITVLSVMDHTPGQGQYADAESWRHAMRARTGGSEAALGEWLARLRDQGDEPARRRRTVAALAGQFDLVLASHDDGGPAAVAGARDAGAAISEFPLTGEAARAAHVAGLGVVMGAPNAWRGGSHLSGLSARAALAAGVLDALTSDYDSGAVLRSVLTLAAEGLVPLSEAVRLISAAPAGLLGLPHGVLQPGRPADLVAVRPGAARPVVVTWVNGRPVVDRRGG